ncbi:MAG: helix-hairpin-helix domain-containing protein [Planctomycetota bacterium]
MRNWEKFCLTLSLILLILSTFFNILRVTSDCHENEISVIKGENRVIEIYVNVNSADAAELILIPGIGEKRAASIIEKRNEKGAISCSDIPELFGTKTAEKIEKYISFDK